MQRVAGIALVEDHLVAAEVAMTQAPADVRQDALGTGCEERAAAQGVDRGALVKSRSWAGGVYLPHVPSRCRSLHSRPVSQRPPPTSVIRSDAHLAHAGLVELMGGVPVPCFEMPERAMEIERALDADGGFALAAPDAFGERTDPGGPRP